MSLRLERRHPRPFPALGIGPARNTPLQARVLKDARDWLADEDAGIGNLLDVPGFDTAYSSVSAELRAYLDDSFPDYAASLCREAMRAPVVLPRLGLPVEAEATLFLVPVFGTEEAVAEFSADPTALADMAEAMVESGLADEESTVRFFPGLYAPGGLSGFRPGAIRRVLRACLPRFSKGGPPGAEDCAAIAAEIASMLPAGASDPPAGGDFVGRVLFGFRVNPSARADLLTDFMPPDLARSRAANEDREDDDVEVMVSEAFAPWNEAMSARFPDLMVGEPNDWCGLLSEVALQHLNACLATEIAHGETPPVDVVHVHEGGDAVEVALSCAGRMVGPVAIPAEMVAADPESFEETLRAYGPRTVRHEEPGSFRALFPLTC